eukprot:scaffold1229_cov60-Phaeocystis_antarctica.AAC.4
MAAAAMAAVGWRPAPAPPAREWPSPRLSRPPLRLLAPQARGARPARLASPALAEALMSRSPPAGWERGADSRRAGSAAAQTSPTSPSSARRRPRERSRPTAPWRARRARCLKC